VRSIHSQYHRRRLPWAVNDRGLLRRPPEAQAVFEGGRLTLVEAGRAAQLADDKLNEVAD
jgi:hypothetical protein